MHFGEITMNTVERTKQSTSRNDGRASRSAVSIVGIATSQRRVQPQFPTIVHALERAAADARNGITLYGDDEKTSFRSYAQIFDEAQRVAGALVARGVRSGDRVLIAMPTSFEFVVTFFAVAWLGAVPVPSYPPAALERFELGVQRLAHIASAAETVVCVTSASLKPLLGELALLVPKLRDITSGEALLAENAAPAPRDPHLSPERICFVQFTSGSTGKPKGVVLTHANVTSNIQAMGESLRTSSEDRGASWLPLYHDMGLIGGLLTPIYWRWRLALMSPMTFIERPVRWLQMISETRATVTASPNFGYALALKRARPRDLEGIDLSSWRIAMNGAEPVNAKMVNEFCAMFAKYGFKPETMLPVYGLAESSLGVTFPEPGKVSRTRAVSREALADGRVEASDGADAAVFTCVGKAIPGHSVVLVDDRGKPVPEGRVGNIVVHGPSIMRGYLNDSSATTRAMRRGWLWTGDLGFMTDEGLYVTGRAKDLIIIRGKNYYAEDAERAVEGIPGAKGGGVVVFGVHDDEAQRDRVTCVCETNLRDPAEREKLVAEIKRRVGEDVGLPLDNIVLVQPGTIPKTSSGKRQRRQTRALYLNKALVPRRTGKAALAGAMFRSAIGKIHLVLRSRRAAA
jgi:acyl-CoA synthetase (AMP-forming)/AMP-acid ligase II